MAVEAQHHHHLFSSQDPCINRETMTTTANQTCLYGIQMSSAAGACSPEPAYNTNQSGGFSINVNRGLSRKRSRDSLSFLGQDLSAQLYDQMLDFDRLIVHHVTNARTELAQRRERFSSQIVATMNESLSKQLKSKDEEIEQLRMLNLALEERIKSLGAENNAWRHLAQTHEAAVIAIKANLEQVLANQLAADYVAAVDAESCCGDNCSVAELACDWKRMCRSCGNREPSALLLPCRHLCLCSACELLIEECPICECSKDGSVNVNFS